MKQRLIGAGILIIILLPLMILGGKYFAFIVGLVALLAAKEINDLNKYPVIIKLLTFFLMISLTFSNFDSSTMLFGLSYDFLSSLLLILAIPVIFYQIKGKYNIEDAFKQIGFILLVGLGLNYFILIRNYELKYFLFMILIPIFTDTFAYVGGVMIGKHKATKISPKKSWEGYIVGTLTATFIMTVFYNTVIGVQDNLVTVILVVFALTVVSHLGDLFFSAIKRHYNIKDFANLIPGHGGVLDRLDSLLFVAIAFINLMSYI